MLPSLVLSATDHPRSHRERRESLWREMEAPSERREPDGEAIDDPAAPLALHIVRSADARKALDITALRVAHMTSATSFFVNMAGRSKAQINAIVKSIEDDVLETYGRRAHRQGKALGGWVCLDYDSVVVNIFSEDQREYYGIDKFWIAAQQLDLSDVLVPNLPESDAAVIAAGDDDVDDWELGEDDEWDLGLDDDWSLDGDRTAVAEDQPVAPFDFDAPSAGSAAWAVVDDPSGEPSDAISDARAASAGTSEADLFSSFAAVAPVDELPELEAIASEEDEAAADAALCDELDDDDDWALGDEALRTIVEKAEQQAAASADGADGADADGGAASWRQMMEQDGWDVENTIEDRIADDEDSESTAEDGFFE